MSHSQVLKYCFVLVGWAGREPKVSVFDELVLTNSFKLHVAVNYMSVLCTLYLSFCNEETIIREAGVANQLGQNLNYISAHNISIKQQIWPQKHLFLR